MKTVILAGGYGTRLSEETGIRPKPLVEVGGKPILWHIMKMYSSYGFDEFIICCGYKGGLIKEYFSNYFLNYSDVTIDLKNNSMDIHNTDSEPWKVTLVDTGEDSMTGGRIKRIKKYVQDEPFFLTYGDGVSDVNIKELLEFHNNNKSYLTVTAVQPPGRFGVFNLGPTGDTVNSFREKPKGAGAERAWINGGFFVVDPKVLEYIDGDDTVFERDPMEKLAEIGHLSAFRHDGYWQSMDTLRDKNVLEEIWGSGNPPWKNW